jgi:hypothetical protein
MTQAMSVFTVVHRALPPLPLPWKRRSLKGKSPLTLDLETSEKTNIPAPEKTEYEPMHREVFNAQIAVSDAREDLPQSPPTPDVTPASPSSVPPTRAQRARAVSWASIVRNRDRWSVKHEMELLHAQKQLDKCQKAWSSEQEVWMVYVCFVFSLCFFLHSQSNYCMQFSSELDLLLSTRH